MFIQVLRCPPLHWILVYRRGPGEDVEVYDSLVSINQELPEPIIRSCAIMTKSHTTTIRVRRMPTQQQNSGVDCGVFAIAHAVDLLESGECDATFDQVQMREHLLLCLKDGEFKPFPKTTQRCKRSKGTYRDHPVYCLCKDVFFDSDTEGKPQNFMAQCSECNEWFHRKCENIPKKVFTSKSNHAEWKCKICAM